MVLATSSTLYTFRYAADHTPQRLFARFPPRKLTRARRPSLTPPRLTSPARGMRSCGWVDVDGPAFTREGRAGQEDGVERGRAGEAPRGSGMQGAPQNGGGERGQVQRMSAPRRSRCRGGWSRESGGREDVGGFSGLVGSNFLPSLASLSNIDVR
jgi:hypothetical protein